MKSTHIHKSSQQFEQDLFGASGHGLPLFNIYARASSKTEQKIPRWGIFCAPVKIAASFYVTPFKVI
jgi:hypothetical protein